MMVNKQILNHNYVNRAGVHHKDPAHGRVSVNPENYQTVIKQSWKHKHGLFRLGTCNVGTLSGRAGEIIETLNQRKIDICCVQEVRWRGASTRTITGKNNSQYKLLWIGNEIGNGGVGTFVAKKWIEKVLEVKLVSDILMMIKLHTNKRTVVAVSDCANQQGLTNDEKDCFYENIIQLIASVNEKDMVIIGGDLNGHVRKDIDRYDGVHGGYGFGVRNTEGEHILEMGAALNMVVCNTISLSSLTVLVAVVHKLIHTC